MAVAEPAPAGRPASNSPPIVEMRHIRVSFGGVHAVNDVSIDLHDGEVIGLVGGNGAGKSTLMKALSGAHPPNAGEILINGKPVSINNPRDAKSYHIETIYQTLALADNIDAPGNVFLGRELTTAWGTMDDGAMERAQERVEQRADGAALDALLVRAREQVEALAAATSALEESLPSRVEEAVQGQAQPLGRNLAEIRGLTNQVIRRLERIEGDLLAERHARVDDLALLVDLVSSGWKSVDDRIGSLERSFQTGEGAIVYRIEERRAETG